MCISYHYCRHLDNNQSSWYLWSSPRWSQWMYNVSATALESTFCFLPSYSSRVNCVHFHTHNCCRFMYLCSCVYYILCLSLSRITLNWKLGLLQLKPVKFIFYIIHSSITNRCEAVCLYFTRFYKLNIQIWHGSRLWHVVNLTGISHRHTYRSRIKTVQPP